MEWIDTPESSTIARCAYDEGAGVLFIEFKKSGTYQYFDVPEVLFRTLMAADSKGQFFGNNIKGVFRYARA
jgi:hypothetical protein